MLRTLLHWINPWMIGGAVVFALVMLAGTFGLLLLTRPANAPEAVPTAVLNVIRAPTATPVPPTPTPDPGLTPSLPVPPSPPPGEIGKGAFVQITGTGGDGLRLRASPGLEGDVKFLALEAEVFQVQDGPNEESGYTWWFLVAPYDEKVKGWAVSNFLQVVQEP
jgi:hypothetical protein